MPQVACSVTGCGAWPQARKEAVVGSSPPETGRGRCGRSRQTPASAADTEHAATRPDDLLLIQSVTESASTYLAPSVYQAGAGRTGTVMRSPPLLGWWGEGRTPGHSLVWRRRPRYLLRGRAPDMHRYLGHV